MRKWAMAVGLMAACMLGVVPMQQEAEASGLVPGALQDIDVDANVLLGGHVPDYHVEPQQERSLVDAEAAIGGNVRSEEKALDAVVCADISLLGGGSSTCGERSKDVAPLQGQNSHPLAADISVRSEAPLLANPVQDADVGLELTGDEGALPIGLAIDGSGNAGNGDGPDANGNVGNSGGNGASANGQGDGDLSEGVAGTGIDASGTISAENDSANGDDGGENGSRDGDNNESGSAGLGNGDETPDGNGSQPLVVGLSTNTSATGGSGLADGTDSLPKTGGWMDARIGFGAALLLIVLGLCLRVFGVKSHETRS